ncbi:MAG: hypothetical protein ACK4NA_00775 [Alphaproteobacteria bacterium]
MNQHGIPAKSSPAPAQILTFSTGWTNSEWATIYRLFEELRARKQADFCESGFTERNEPQFYIFNGRGPDACLTISRVIIDSRRIYLAHNRHGEMLAEGDDLTRIADFTLYKRVGFTRDLKGAPRLLLVAAALAGQAAALGIEVTMEYGSTLMLGASGLV